MSMILEGIRVVDWTMYMVGPVAGAMLGDLGAEVIHIEERGRGDRMREMPTLYGELLFLPHGRHALFENHNRNKKGIALNLKKPQAREIVYRLVEKSDVFLTNFRRRAAAKLGLDYETLSKYNPKIIYTHASGYGMYGPDAALPCVDKSGQARSGIMMTTGEPDDPPIPITDGGADKLAGTMAAYATLAALFARERLGIGQEVEVSQTGALVMLQEAPLAVSLLKKRDLPRTSRKANPTPVYNVYQCQDGKWIVIALLEEHYWPVLCRAMGLEEIEKDPRFENIAKRQENCEELIAILDRAFATRTREEWEGILKEADLIYARVNSLADLPSDPQVVANQWIVDVNHPVLGPVKLPGQPFMFSKTPAGWRGPAPDYGQHTEEVLSGLLGYTPQQVSELRKLEVI